MEHLDQRSQIVESPNNAIGNVPLAHEMPSPIMQHGAPRRDIILIPSDRRAQLKDEPTPEKILANQKRKWHDGDDQRAAAVEAMYLPGDDRWEKQRVSRSLAPFESSRRDTELYFPKAVRAHVIDEDASKSKTNQIQTKKPRITLYVHHPQPVPKPKVSLRLTLPKRAPATKSATPALTLLLDLLFGSRPIGGVNAANAAGSRPASWISPFSERLSSNIIGFSAGRQLRVQRCLERPTSAFTSSRPRAGNFVATILGGSIAIGTTDDTSNDLSDEEFARLRGKPAPAFRVPPRLEIRREDTTSLSSRIGLAALKVHFSSPSRPSLTPSADLVVIEDYEKTGESGASTQSSSPDSEIGIVQRKTIDVEGPSLEAILTQQQQPRRQVLAPSPLPLHRVPGSPKAGSLQHGIKRTEREFAKIVGKTRTIKGIEYKLVWQRTWKPESELGIVQGLVQEFEAKHGGNVNGARRHRQTEANYSRHAIGPKSFFWDR
ncbi:MAG: hypothetical protein Q9217_004690 [Psora testacea]